MVWFGLFVDLIDLNFLFLIIGFVWFNVLKLSSKNIATAKGTIKVEFIEKKKVKIKKTDRDREKVYVCQR